MPLWASATSQQRQREVSSLRRLIPATTLEEDSEGTGVFRRSPGLRSAKEFAILAWQHSRRPSLHLHRRLAIRRGVYPKPGSHCRLFSLIPMDGCPFWKSNECNLATKRWNDLECPEFDDPPSSPLWLLVCRIIPFLYGPVNVADQSGGQDFDGGSSGGIDFGIRNALGIGHEEGVPSGK